MNFKERKQGYMGHSLEGGKRMGKLYNYNLINKRNNLKIIQSSSKEKENKREF